MDGFIQELLQFHGNGKHRQNWQSLKDCFSRHASVVERAALQRDASRGTVLLGYAHDVSSSLRASLIVTLLLVYQMEFMSEEANEIFCTEVRLFFDYITAQEAECASEELARLAHTMTRLTCEDGCPAKVIPSLSRLSSTVSPNPSCLTAIHADILQACISGKMYSFAHDFISNITILEIKPKQCYLEPLDFLKYFYYSGIVYISVKNFGKALECFNEVLSFPSEVLSAVCIEAYKKAVFVSLIYHGKPFKEYFPGNASAPAKKLSSTENTENLSSLEPYHLVEKLFIENNLSNSSLEDEVVMTALAIDNNTGLAKQVVGAMYNHRIIKISKAYMSLSLDRLTCLVGGGFTSESMEKKLISLNIQELIVMKINKLTRIVTFEDLSSRYHDSNELLDLMRSQLQEAGRLSDTLRNLHQEVLVSEKHLKKSVVSAVEGKNDENTASIALVDHDDMEEWLD